MRLCRPKARMLIHDNRYYVYTYTARLHTTIANIHRFAKHYRLHQNRFWNWNDSYLVGFHFYEGQHHKIKSQQNAFPLTAILFLIPQPVMASWIMPNSCWVYFCNAPPGETRWIAIILCMNIIMIIMIASSEKSPWPRFTALLTTWKKYTDQSCHPDFTDVHCHKQLFKGRRHLSIKWRPKTRKSFTLDNRNSVYRL